MGMTRSRQATVLQGYFRQPFRGAGRATAPGVGGVGSPRASGATRSALLFARMAGGIARPGLAPGSDGGWPHAPRPELLPGMGAPRGMAQARIRVGVTTTQLPAGQLRLIGNGKPIDPGIRDSMEAFFHADFSTVRVHEGPVAQTMGALAFTLGETLYFAPGLYDPSTREGVELLGHELAHVVQQRDGRVTNPQGDGIAIVQDPELEAEADQLGRQITDQLWSRPRSGQPALALGAGWSSPARAETRCLVQPAPSPHLSAAAPPPALWARAPRPDLLPGGGSLPGAFAVRAGQPRSIIDGPGSPGAVVAQRTALSESTTYEPSEEDWKYLFDRALAIKGTREVGAAGSILYTDDKWGAAHDYRNGYRVKKPTRLVTTHQSKPRLTKHSHDSGTTDHRWDAEVSVVDRMLWEKINARKTPKFALIVVVGEDVCEYCQWLIELLAGELRCTIVVGVYRRRQIQGTVQYDWRRVHRYTF